MFTKEGCFMKFYMSYFEKMASGEIVLNSRETRVFGVLGLNSQYGGTVKITQKAISKKIQMDPAQVSKAIKGLVEKNIIVKKRNDMGLYYQFEKSLIAKGNNKYQEDKIKRNFKVIKGKLA